MPDSPAPPLKDWFDEARYRALARALAALAPGFAERRFLGAVMDGLEDRSLMDRLHQCAVATEAALPGTYRQKICVLQRLAPTIDHEFVAIFLCDVVATYGLSDFEFSLEALRFFTVFGSAEFAVRPFLVADQARALAVMRQWSSDANEKVRRLASEGSRPRLPWGMRLPAFIRDPSPTAEILETLKGDASLMVRRSVANHLNDITKDHPEYVLDRLRRWDLDDPRLQWIARHACRTLIKRGDRGALHLFGYGDQPRVKATLKSAPARLTLGDRLSLIARLTSTTDDPQQLALDYVIHYVKATGRTSEKVFKWTEIDLPARQSLTVTKSQVIRDCATRRHFAGRHRIELQVNGARLATSNFHLE